MRKMKDSGVPWIGEIPEEWDIVRLRYLCDIITGNKDTIDNNPEGEYPFYVRSPIVERIDSYSFNGEAVLTAGDGVGAGKVFHYANGKFDFHQRVYCFHNFGSIKAKFFYYYMKENFYKEMESGSAKNTVDSIRLPMLQNYPIPCPQKPSEQNRIVNYLDCKCAEIDSVIKAKEAINEKLKEYRQSVIYEAVTKGLDKNAKMKDSGIEYIGEIPVEWQVWRLKHLAKNPLQYGANVGGVDYSEELPRYIRITDITQENNLRDDDKLSLTNEQAESYILNEGDVLFARSGATAGKSFYYTSDIGRSCFAGYLIRFSAKEDIILSRLVYYYTLTTPYSEWVNQVFIQATIQNISAEKYNNLFLAVPPTIKEQQQIVDYLDNKCNEIGTIILSNEKTIEKLKEYRQSVIYEAVTGKVEI